MPTEAGGERRPTSVREGNPDRCRSWSLPTVAAGVPRPMSERKLSLRWRQGNPDQNLATNKKLPKTEFCKTNHISVNSINKGLETLGVKIRKRNSTNIRKKYNNENDIPKLKNKSRHKAGITNIADKIINPKSSLNSFTDDIVD